MGLLSSPTSPPCPASAVPVPGLAAQRVRLGPRLLIPASLTHPLRRQRLHSSWTRRAGIAGCCALLLLGLACGSKPEAESGEQKPATDHVTLAPRQGGTVVIAYSSDIDGVNELVHGSTQPMRHVLEQMFLRLLHEQPDFTEQPPTFEPRLAESYEFSDDHLTLTFRLRRNAVWSDGVPITAEDVRWTWQAQNHPAVAWDNVVMKASIRDVEVVDPYTVRYHFTHAYPGQLVHANEGNILPKHAWSQLPFDRWRQEADWFTDHLVVSGPFRLASWRPNQDIVLEPNERYFEDDIPYLDRVVFRILPDPAAQYQAFLSGEVDFLRQLTASTALEVTNRPGNRLITFYPPAYCSVIWNLRRPQFQDARVRRALTLGIDRQAIVDTLWFGFAQIGSSPVISTLWGHKRDLPPLPYDPERARGLLDEAGWIDRDGNGVRENSDGVQLTFDLLVNAGNNERKNAAEMIQQQLRQVGIEARPRTLDWNTVGARLESRNFDATIVALGVETSIDLSSTFHSRGVEHELNYSGYADDEADRLLDEARQQVQLQDTLPYLHQLQELLHRDQPVTLLWESQRLIGIKERVHGAEPNALSDLDNLRYWWVADAPAD